MNGVIQDLRYALRQLRKTPGFTAVAVITLALGIGANTAVFSVIDAVMLRPLPYYKPERLIAAESVNSRAPGFGALSYPDFFDWRNRNRTLEHLVSYHDDAFTLNGLDRPVHLDGEVVSWDLLTALGVSPELGRSFTSDEEKVGTRVVCQIGHLTGPAVHEVDFEIPASIAEERDQDGLRGRPSRIRTATRHDECPSH